MDFFRECQFCGEFYPSKSSLSHHKRNSHPQEHAKKKKALEAKHGRVTCPDCAINVANDFSLSRHRAAKHPDKVPSQPKKTTRSICGESGCSFTAVTCQGLREHLAEVHGFQLKELRGQFPNLESFGRWRKKIEAETGAQFILCRGARTNSDGSITKYFQCNRSGSKNLKSGKRRKSGKMDKNCTAEIAIKVQPNESVTMRASLFHYGHQLDGRPEEEMEVAGNEALVLLGKRDLFVEIFGEKYPYFATRLSLGNHFASEEPVRFKDFPKDLLNFLDFIIIRDYLRLFFISWLKGDFFRLPIAALKFEDEVNGEVWREELLQSSKCLLFGFLELSILKQLLGAKAFKAVEAFLLELSEFWICSSCRLVCNSPMVDCSSCNCWYHLSCVSLANPSLEWTCNKCVSA